MSDIGATELDAALEALADQLAELGTRLHLVVIGGSGLIAIDAVARTTRDVDVVALSSSTPRQTAGSPETSPTCVSSNRR